jgi:glycosyltransferase involved in cell wall biosynthesis
MRDPSRPKVSVIIPCFNRGHFLDDAVSSCIEAYAGPLEIVVVDDGSTDPRTARYIDGLRELNCPEIHVVRQANAGPARARNVGIARSTGTYIQFLDSDDLLYRNKIEHQIRHLALDPDVDVSVSDYHLCDETRTAFTRPPPSIEPFPLTLENFLFDWERALSIPIHAALFRRAALAGASQPWPEIVRGKEDWLFWVGLKMRGVRMAYLPLRLCAYRIHGQNMTRAWSEMREDFVTAAREIEKWLGGRHPEFLEQRTQWASEFYARCAAETEAAAAKAKRASTGDAAAPGVGAPVPMVTSAPASSAGDAVRAAAATISVVVPVFDHARYLERCIRSAHLQSLRPREIVCVDDASTDPAVRPLLQALAAEIPGLQLRLLERNRGIAAVQNLAVRMATGDFVAFLDCDDFLHPSAIETVATVIAEHPQCDYVFTDRYEVDADDHLLRHAVYGGYPNRPHLDRTAHRENLLDTMVASHLKVIRRSAVLGFGGFDERTSGVQDWDLALKIAERGSLEYVPRPVYYHRVHGSSVTLGQRVRMFRLTNEVRRRHQAVRARKSADAAPSSPGRAAVARFMALRIRDGHDGAGFRWDATLQAWVHPEHGLAIVRAPPSFRDAFRLWSRTPSTVFALPPDAPQTTIDFLREFNSYFDLIACADEAQWAMLHRYAWDPRALRLASELSEPRGSGARATAPACRAHGASA